MPHAAQIMQKYELQRLSNISIPIIPIQIADKTSHGADYYLKPDPITCLVVTAPLLSKCFLRKFLELGNGSIWR